MIRQELEILVLGTAKSTKNGKVTLGNSQNSQKTVLYQDDTRNHSGRTKCEGAVSKRVGSAYQHTYNKLIYEPNVGKYNF